MSASLQLSVLSELADCRRCTADGLSSVLDEHIEDVYAALVRLEADGLARVVVEHKGQQRRCYWQAL